MSDALTVESIATDLAFAAEVEPGDWGYEMSEDGTFILAELYANNGTVESTYEIRLTIVERHDHE